MGNSLFLKIFPVPKIMGMVAAGVDISDSAIRFVYFSFRGSELKLKGFGAYPLPAGAFSQGKIHNPAAVKDALVRMKNEHGMTFVHASIPEAQSYLVEMDISSDKGDDVRESIELQFEEHIPLKVAESNFDYQKEDTGRSGNFKAYVAAVPAETVSAYQDVFASAGLTLLSLEVDAYSIARGAIRADNTETVMIVNVCREKTGMYIVSGNTVQFVSSIDIGGRDFPAVTAKALNISEDEAAKKLAECADEDAPKQEIAKALNPLFAGISDDIGKHLLYWQSRRNGTSKGKVTRIVLAGPGAGTPGLASYLASSLHVPAEPANIWANLISFEHYIPMMSFCDSLLYSTAIGLAARCRE